MTTTFETSNHQFTHPNTLLVLLGPTGVGKTKISIDLSVHFNAPIISSDSRQFYRELKIGTAAPSTEELSRARHFFVGTHSIFDRYNAGQFEQDVLVLLPKLFMQHHVVMLVGGSMMYIDAICNGMDNIPTVDAETRKYWQHKYWQNGLPYIQHELKKLDFQHYKEVDLKNPKRILHALEICTITGKPYSELRTGTTKKRDFNILKIGVNRSRPELYNRINERVDRMMEEGLLREARELYPYKSFNTLNTVGYKELFEYMDGICTLEEAVQKIKQDSRRYAKRQMTWFNKDELIHWFHPDETSSMLSFIANQLST
jgi:tRNA dimethylallyltransferase